MAGRMLWWCTALLTVAGSPGCHARGAGGEKTDPAVRESLRRDGVAHVVVALEPPAGYDAAEADAGRMAAAIAAVQQRVLAAIDSTDFRLRQTFRNVPALAGTVLSERGLELLSAHADVLRIDPDRGGGGTR